jgi:hypothetical protein
MVTQTEKMMLLCLDITDGLLDVVISTSSPALKRLAESVRAKQHEIFCMSEAEINAAYELNMEAFNKRRSI